MDIQFLILLTLFTKSNCDLVLKQVLILSRHNVRTPLAKNLELMTPKIWPVWKEKRGYLTAKGALLEGFMGAYFSKWLQKEGLLTDQCPTEQELYVYANSAQRTVASAQAFVDDGFPGCNVTVHSQTNSDPIFNPIVHNKTAAYKQEALDQMQKKLRLLSLKSCYDQIEKILDYEQSKLCLEQGKCDLNTDKNQPYVAAGAKPNLTGPLKISKSAIDSFIMENYEGFHSNEVAWGMLPNEQKWYSIIDLSRGYHNVIFNTTVIAKDVAKPLVKYMSEMLLKDDPPKVLFLMGHDANIYTVLNLMGFKPYYLEKQYEVTPAGGKIVFQKWWDKKIKQYFLKVNYVYQSTDGMRKGYRLSLEYPPEFTLLELNGCTINNEGYCPWQDFKKLLTKFISA
ncbi:glucose-1-phosphatase-like [Manduca sexta]|uniref:Glucose-1-phosphatase n=1 Tax=Manduca sexta TaxID=7130 RepID=A0A922D2M0_MANSE|nr:glucose-1-phosphatase-like [Manduca sexta]KAG6464898.1 hypothetical protein O3G_MSEX014798 [Manduca sexta]